MTHIDISAHNMGRGIASPFFFPSIQIHIISKIPFERDIGSNGVGF